MYILVLGSNTEKLQSMVSKDVENKFHFVSEVTSVISDIVDGSMEVIINDKLVLSDYHGVILNDTSSMYNYLWSESLDIPWFTNPFSLRQAANHNFFSAMAKLSGFKVPFGKPEFSSGKIAVNRNFPEGEEFSMFISTYSEFSFKEYPQLSRRFIRNCSRYLKNLNVSFGIGSFIVDENNTYWLTNFKPTFDWNKLSDSNVKFALERVLFSSKIVAKRKGYI